MQIFYYLSPANSTVDIKHNFWMCVTSPNKKPKIKVFTEAESQSLNPERNKKNRKRQTTVSRGQTVHVF